EEPKEEELLVNELLKQNSVLFIDTGCFVLSLDFKLNDESRVLLKVPRRNNMYTFDMKNIVPKESLTCPVVKATLDESMLWHRRLDGSIFDTSSKNASNDEQQPSSDAGHKDVEGVRKESGIGDQERPSLNTANLIVNTAGPSINTASTNDNAKVDMRKFSNTYQVPTTPNTRIHKDHSLDHVIGDV
nr:ribonuclease H-like domain-containing protein [Tanacetum cinerariifolium]